MNNVSFIILSPLLGYKDGSKKILKLDSFYRNVKEINKLFSKPDIVLITGKKLVKEYSRYKPGFRICENQLINTGEIEQIRLGINNIVNEKLVILKEDVHIDFRLVKKHIKSKSPFITMGQNELNPGMIIQNNLVHNISFGIDNFFGDLFFVEKTMNTVVDFVNRPHNINKKLHELVNHLVNVEPMKVIK